MEWSGDVFPSDPAPLHAGKLYSYSKIRFNRTLELHLVLHLHFTSSH